MPCIFIGYIWDTNQKEVGVFWVPDIEFSSLYSLLHMDHT